MLFIVLAVKSATIYLWRMCLFLHSEHALTLDFKKGFIKIVLPNSQLQTRQTSFSPSVFLIHLCSYPGFFNPGILFLFLPDRLWCVLCCILYHTFKVTSSSYKVWFSMFVLACFGLLSQKHFFNITNLCRSKNHTELCLIQNVHSLQPDRSFFLIGRFFVINDH